MASSSAVAQASRGQETRLISKQDSLQVMRNVLRSSLSTICFMRDLFHGDFFDQQKYGNQKVELLNIPENAESVHGKETVDQVRLFMLWLEEGVFHALQNEYLKRLEFIIYEPDIADGEHEERVLERFHYNFAYADDGVSFTGDEGVTNITMRSHVNRLIRHLIKFGTTLPALPQDRSFTIKLRYFEDITPDGYQPPFFRQSTREELAPWGQDGLGKENDHESILKMRVGQVLTPHVDLKLKFYGRDLTLEDDEDGLSSQLTHLTVRENAPRKQPSLTESRPHALAPSNTISRAAADAPSGGGDHHILNRARQFVLGRRHYSVSKLAEELKVSKTQATALLNDLTKEGLLRLDTSGRYRPTSDGLQVGKTLRQCAAETAHSKETYMSEPSSSQVDSTTSSQPQYYYDLPRETPLTQSRLSLKKKKSEDDFFTPSPVNVGTPACPPPLKHPSMQEDYHGKRSVLETVAGDGSSYETGGWNISLSQASNAGEKCSIAASHIVQRAKRSKNMPTTALSSSARQHV